MKSFLRTILINFFSLFFIAKFIGGINYSENFLVLFWAAVFLAVLNLLVKPLLNILMTPINFLTLGAFRWVINIIILFIVTLFIPEFKIIGFTISSFSRAGFTLPEIRLTFFWALFLISFLLEIIPSIIYWVIK